MRRELFSDLLAAGLLETLCMCWFFAAHVGANVHLLKINIAEVEGIV